jgi:prevent-host-death family protein
MYHRKIGGKKMFNTHVKAVRDLRNNYPEVAKIIKNYDHVIITNNGKSEAVIIPYEHLEDYQEYLHVRYVKDKLTEAEAIEDNFDAWLSIDEVFKNLDNWGTKK